MRILLVDDEETTRRRMAGLLQLGGHVWADAADGLEGLTRLADFPADLIITDCQMPRMDGISFARCLRARKIDTPILMVSGQTDRRIIQAALSAGVTYYLPKPLTAEQLFDLLHRISAAPSRMAG